MKKNRVSLYIVSGLLVLAFLGVTSSLMSNPTVFVQRIAFILIVIGAIYLLFRRSYKAGPEKNEQQAFIKAAKKSKKRFKNKDNVKTQKSSVRSLTSLKKKTKKKSVSTAHLTVIEGKKGKKKNRASF